MTNDKMREALMERLYEWLRREMPAGTVIDDPDWWAPRIARAMLAAQPAAVPEGFAAWLRREMPADTVIGDPDWWAPRIARAMLAAAPKPEQQNEYGLMPARNCPPMPPVKPEQQEAPELTDEEVQRIAWRHMSDLTGGGIKFARAIIAADRAKRGAK